MHPPKLILLPLLALLAGASLLVAGCGGSDSGDGSADRAVTDRTTTDRALPDRAIAHAALLQRDDLPAGFTATPNSRTGDADCAPFDRMREQPHAESESFSSSEGSAFAGQVVAIFPTPEDVDRALEESSTQAALACIDDYLRRIMLDGAANRVRVGRVTVEYEDAPLGERSGVVHIKIPVHVKGGLVTVSSDFLYIGVGRGLTGIAAGGTGGVEGRFLDHVDDRAVARLEDALEG